ncbi:MAG TPA: serine/threonine-protein kinase [Polyangiaceae bacterium]
MVGNRSLRTSSKDWTGRTLFGKWTVERVIGAGGTSTVLQARHRNGRRAALKVLHRHLADQGRMRERFLREGRLANLVNHPGVVAVLDDFVTDDGTAVLVLELVDGKTLSALAKESGGHLTQHAVVTAAKEVLDILAVAHEANVVHRDIKPENILLCENGTYKLADFGLAGLCHELGMLTGLNQTLGTPAYMSPEQARGDAQHVDVRTDIWGLGATMFTLLTGRYVHAGSAQKNLVVAAATEPAPAVRSIEPDLDPSLAAIIDRALRTDKEERWPNALAMLAELRAIVVPMSEVRPVRAAPGHDNTTLSTAPFSRASSSQAETSWTRTGARRRLELVLALVALAVLITFIVLVQSTDVPTTATESPAEAKTLERPRPTHSITKALPNAPDARQETRKEAPPSRESSRTPLKPKRVNDRRKVDATPLVKANSTPLVSLETEPGASIPDAVLDRRE